MTIIPITRVTKTTTISPIAQAGRVTVEFRLGINCSVVSLVGVTSSVCVCVCVCVCE